MTQGRRCSLRTRLPEAKLGSRLKVNGVGICAVIERSFYIRVVAIVAAEREVPWRFEGGKNNTVNHLYEIRGPTPT